MQKAKITEELNYKHVSISTRGNIGNFQAGNNWFALFFLRNHTESQRSRFSYFPPYRLEYY